MEDYVFYIVTQFLKTFALDTTMTPFYIFKYAAGFKFRKKYY